MDRLEAMRVLLAVVDAGNLTAGSRKLGAALPSVSRKVAELERHLGTNLLVRTSRNIQLTDAGRDYVEAARRILAELEEAERRASGEYQTPRGELAVTMPVEFGLRHMMPIALSFMDEYPDVSLRLVTIDRLLNLVEEQIDIAVRLGELADSALFAVKVGEFRVITCASPSYLDRRGTPRQLADLAAHDGILFGNHDMAWTYRDDGTRVATEPRVRLTATTVAAARAAALGGVGITRLANYQVADELRSGALVPVLRDFDSAPLPVHIVYQRQGLLPLKVRAFIDWAIPRLRSACLGFDCG